MVHDFRFFFSSSDRHKKHAQQSRLILTTSIICHSIYNMHDFVSTILCAILLTPLGIRLKYTYPNSDRNAYIATYTILDIPKLLARTTQLAKTQPNRREMHERKTYRIIEKQINERKKSIKYIRWLRNE